MNKTLIICLISIGILLANLFIVCSEDDVVLIPLKFMNITEPQPQIMIMTSSSNEPVQIDNIKEKVDGYLKEKVGENYFEEHFNFYSTEEKKDIVCLNYEYAQGEYKTDMHVCYDILKNKTIPQMSSFLETPQEIIFKESNAIQKAEDLGLPLPKDIELVYNDVSNSLGWKILWKHEPTNEERQNNTIQGYILSVTDGIILKTYKFHFEPVGVPNLEEKENIRGEIIKEETSMLKKIINFLSKILEQFRGK